METYFNLPHIGELKIEHQFYALNGEPILFVCKDMAGVRYLCSCCRMYEQWVIAQADEAMLVKLIGDEVTIRDVFQMHNGAVILVSWDGERFDVDNSVSADFFPKAGAKLELPYEKGGEYYSQLKRTAQQKALRQSFASVAEMPSFHWQFFVNSSATLWDRTRTIVSEYAESYKRYAPRVHMSKTYCIEISVSEIMQRIAEASNATNTMVGKAVVPQTFSMSKKARDTIELREQMDFGYDCSAA